MQIKQVVMVEKRRVELQTATLDENPGADGILIRTERTFISAGTELANYTAREPAVYQKGSWCAYPWRAGYANVGIVEAGAVTLKWRLPGGKEQTKEVVLEKGGTLKVEIR